MSIVALRRRFTLSVATVGPDTVIPAPKGRLCAKVLKTFPGTRYMPEECQKPAAIEIWPAGQRHLAMGYCEEHIPCDVREANEAVQNASKEVRKKLRATA